MFSYAQADAAVKRNDTTGVCLPQPTAKYWYFDKIRIWLKVRLREWRIDWLREHCRGGLYEEQERERKCWDPRYVMCLQLYQPDDEALRWLANLGRQVLLNYAEVALDLVFNNKQEADAANELIRRYHIKKWHGSQLVLFCRGIVRYSGPRRAANLLVVYADRPCRLSGDVYCLHLEWRLNGSRALQRAGLGTVSDLLELDHREFWLQRLLLRQVKLPVLGRLFSKHVLRWERRGASMIEDGRIGERLLRSVGSEANKGTTQALVDRFRRRFEVSRCLQEIDVSELLPTVSADRYNLCVTQAGIGRNDKGLREGSGDCGCCAALVRRQTRGRRKHWWIGFADGLRSAAVCRKSMSANYYQRYLPIGTISV